MAILSPLRVKIRKADKPKSDNDHTVFPSWVGAKDTKDWEHMYGTPVGSRYEGFVQRCRPKCSHGMGAHQPSTSHSDH